MNGFLPQLKKLQPLATAKGTRTMVGKDILFMLKKGEEDTFVVPVDHKLKPVEADFHYYQGDTAQMLRSLDAAREDMSYQISWGNSDDDNHVSLNKNPHLLYQLIRCKNIVDESGTSIKVHADNTTLQLVLGRDGKNLIPRLAVTGEEEDAGDNGADSGLLQDGTQQQDDTQQQATGIRFLSDSFVLLPAKGDKGAAPCSTLYPIMSVGDNYRQLGYFLTPFAEDMLEQFLSVFFSFVENVQVVYEDYEVEFSENDITPTPSLSFEKIDADKTLFLRLMESVKGLPLDFVQQFELSMIASLSLEKKIKVRRLAHLPLADTAAALRKEIVQYAPNKAAQKDVYVEDNLFIIPEETAGPFLLHALPSLLKTYQLVGAEKLRQYKVKPMIPKPALQLAKRAAEVCAPALRIHLLCRRTRHEGRHEAPGHPHHLRRRAQRHQGVYQEKIPLRHPRRKPEHQEHDHADHTGRTHAAGRTPTGTERHTCGKQPDGAVLPLPLPQPHHVRHPRRLQQPLRCTHTARQRQGHTSTTSTTRMCSATAWSATSAFRSSGLTCS